MTLVLTILSSAQSRVGFFYFFVVFFLPILYINADPSQMYPKVQPDYPIANLW